MTLRSGIRRAGTAGWRAHPPGVVLQHHHHHQQQQQQQQQRELSSSLPREVFKHRQPHTRTPLSTPSSLFPTSPPPPPLHPGNPRLYHTTIPTAFAPGSAPGSAHTSAPGSGPPPPPATASPSRHESPPPAAAAAAAMTDGFSYALDLPIAEHGGPEHVRRSLAGEALDPANYRFTSADGTSIVYHACGRGPLLLIGACPGWGIGINYLPNGFRRIVASGRVTFLALQTRGTLPSERPADEARMGSRHMAEDIEHLRCHVGAPSCSVLGHSNGAAIALDFAARFPARCDRAVLIDSQVIGYSGGGDTFMQGLARREKDPRFHDAAVFFMTKMLPAMAGGVDKFITSDEQLTDLILNFFDLYFQDPERYKAVFFEQTGPLRVQHWAYLAQTKADAHPDANTFEKLGSVTAKVFVASGKDDFICSVGSSVAMCEAIGANAKHVIYPNSGHMPWIEEEDAFFHDVFEFLFGEGVSHAAQTIE